MIVDTVFLEKGLNATFDAAMQQLLSSPMAQATDALFQEQPSTSASEKYAWLGDYPQAQEWLGDKVSGWLKDYDYTIANKDWYTAVDIDRNEIRDDQLGRLLPRIQGMAQALGSFKFNMLLQLLNNSLTDLAFDGSAYFANRAAPNDNLLAGAGTTLANIVTDLVAARQAMQAFTTDQGRTLGIAPDTVVVPTALEYVMRQAVNADLAGLSGERVYNPFKDWIRNIIAIPGLTDTSDWYLFNTTAWMKPFIYQVREAPNMELDDTQSHRNRKLTYSANLRANGGYGLPICGIRIVNA
jgi:phage major head subunit gpT-like protein